MAYVGVAWGVPRVVGSLSPVLDCARSRIFLGFVRFCAAPWSGLEYDLPNLKLWAIVWCYSKSDLGIARPNLHSSRELNVWKSADVKVNKEVIVGTVLEWRITKFSWYFCQMRPEKNQNASSVAFHNPRGSIGQPWTPLVHLRCSMYQYMRAPLSKGVKVVLQWLINMCDNYWPVFVTTVCKTLKDWTVLTMECYDDWWLMANSSNDWKSRGRRQHAYG